MKLIKQKKMKLENNKNLKKPKKNFYKQKR